MQWLPLVADAEVGAGPVAMVALGVPLVLLLPGLPLTTGDEPHVRADLLGVTLRRVLAGSVGRS